MINPTITISQNEYEYLVEQAKIVKFIGIISHQYVMTARSELMKWQQGDGLITTVRYGTLSECVKCAIEDIRAMQSVYWVGEETEIYAGNSLEEILHAFYSEKEHEEILGMATMDEAY